MKELPECGKDICCYVCGEIATCGDACGQLDVVNVPPLGNCEAAVDAEGAGIQVFESNAAAVIKGIADTVKQKRALEEQETALREQLEKAMNECGVKKFENELLSITYVAATTRTSIDSKALKKDLPEIAEKYSKVSNVKASIKITIK